VLGDFGEDFVGLRVAMASREIRFSRLRWRALVRSF